MPSRRQSELRTTNMQLEISIYLDIIARLVNNGFAPRRRGQDPERIAERVERAGCKGPESLLVALAAHATIASPLTRRGCRLDRLGRGPYRGRGSPRETAGVVFTFNTINRIADARRVRLEYRFLRELKPIEGWVERRLASLTGLAYDLSYKHQARHSPAEMLDRLGSCSSAWVHRLCPTSSTG